MLAVEMPLYDLEIASVGAEEEVGNRADQRDHPQKPVHPNVPAHPGDTPFGHAESPRLPGEICSDRGGCRWAGERHEVEDNVEAYRMVDAGQDDDPFHQP